MNAVIDEMVVSGSVPLLHCSCHIGVSGDIFGGVEERRGLPALKPAELKVMTQRRGMPALDSGQYIR